MRPVAAMLPELLRQLGLAQVAEGWRAVADWPVVAGVRIARRSRAVGFRDGALVVEVEGSAWMHELGFLKPELVRSLNRHLGADVVRDVRFVPAVAHPRDRGTHPQDRGSHSQEGSGGNLR
jgi:predicted nucleic acid-binding Zn ribbon protein